MSQHDVCVWESYVRGPRWVCSSDFIEVAVSDWNGVVQRQRKDDWGTLEIVYLKERTTLMTRTLLFKIRGQRLPLSLFQKALDKAVSGISGS